MTDKESDKVSRTDCAPWRDAETLRHFYRWKRYSLLETAETIGCTEGTISKWCDRLGVETRDFREARDAGTPERLASESWLREQYVDKQRTCADISEQVGCTDTTVSRWLRRHGIPTRERHRPQKRVTLTCENCGEEFEAIESQSGKKYCDRSCYFDALDMPSGEEHWSWKATPEHRPAGEAWERLREEVRSRDGYTCQMCGREESDMDRTLDVHHLKRVRDMDGPRAAEGTDPDLLVSLCRSCHRRAERYAPLLPEV